MNLPADLQRLAPVAAIGIVAVVATLLVVHGLGGGPSKTPAKHATPGASAAQELDRTFRGPGPASGRYEVTAALALEGAPSPAANPYTLEGAGAFARGASGAPPKVELGATATTVGDKRPVRLVSSSLALHPRGWLTHPVDAGTAQVGGVETRHVSAAVNVPALVRDVGAAVGSAAGRTGLAGDVRSLGASLRDVKAEVYTGASDHALRRLTITGAAAAGGRLSFDLRLTDLGKPQAIPAHRAATPKHVAARPAPKRHVAPKPAVAKRHPAQRRTVQGYVTCVQGAQDLQALERCQALLPRR